MIENIGQQGAADKSQKGKYDFQRTGRPEKENAQIPAKQSVYQSDGLCVTKRLQPLPGYGGYETVYEGWNSDQDGIPDTQGVFVAAASRGNIARIDKCADSNLRQYSN